MLGGEVGGEPQLSRDAMWDGALTLWQPAKGQGYRFNLDPVLLYGFIAPTERVLELGAGCGILSVLLLAGRRCDRVTAVERQPALAAACRRNAVDNGLQSRLDTLCADLRSVALPERYDVVAFNPPYFPAEEGRASPDPGRDAGRRERYGTLADFVACATRHLDERGVLCAIVRWERREELIALAAGADLEHVTIRPVIPRPGAAPRHALINVRRGEGPRLCNEPPLIVHREGSVRDFSDEVSSLLAPPSDSRGAHITAPQGS